MRSKEDANDYRYFPDPDLLPILINSEVIDRVKQEMPESPQKTHDRFRKDFGLSESETNQICSDRSTAGYYEQAVAATESKIKSKDANKLVLHWILGDLFAHLKRDEKDIKNAPIYPTKLAQLVDKISDGTLSSKLAKKVFEEIWHTNKEVGDVISEQGFVQITDQEQIGKIIDDVIESNPNLVNDYQNGKSKAFNAMIGQVMKATQGKANPKQVSSILKGKLS